MATLRWVVTFASGGLAVACASAPSSRLPEQSSVEGQGVEPASPVAPGPSVTALSTAPPGAGAAAPSSAAPVETRLAAQGASDGPPPAPAPTDADAVASPPTEDAATLLAALPAASRAELPFLERVCRVAVGRYPVDWDPPTGGSVAVGCECCAPFEDCPPVAGALPAVKEARELYGLRHRSRGSFTAAGKEQIAATFWGCEPGAGSRGGTAVFEGSKGPLRLVAYHTAVNPDACQPLRASDGHDLLVCHLTDGQGGYGYTRVLLLDLAQAKHDSGGYDEIDTLPLDGICLLDAGMPYAVTKLQALTLRDVDGDGRKDVVLDVEHQGGVVSAADLAACRAATEFGLWPSTLPKPVRHRFEYRFDGKSLKPRPGTEALRHKLYDAHAKFWSELRGG